MTLFTATFFFLVLGVVCRRRCHFLCFVMVVLSCGFHVVCLCSYYSFVCFGLFVLLVSVFRYFLARGFLTRTKHWGRYLREDPCTTLPLPEQHQSAAPPRPEDNKQHQTTNNTKQQTTKQQQQQTNKQQTNNSKQQTNNKQETSANNKQQITSKHQTTKNKQHQNQTPNNK